jgi:hypothetical protein
MCKVSENLFVYGDVLSSIVNKQQRIRIVKCLVMCIISKGLNFKLMAPPKRKCLFSDVLKCKYPFLISDETDVNKVRCTLYKSVFSVTHGGRNDIETHIRAINHKESLAAKASSKKH